MFLIKYNFDKLIGYFTFEIFLDFLFLDIILQYFYKKKHYFL